MTPPSTNQPTRLPIAHAQIQLSLRQTGTVNLQLLATFLKLLGRTRWAFSPAPAGGAGSGSAGGSEQSADLIFIYSDDPKLPQPLSQHLGSESSLQEEVTRWLKRAAWQDGSEVHTQSAEKFTPGAPAPFGLSDAGGLSPKAVALAVAEGKLLGGRGDAAAWGREYVRLGGSAKELQALQESVTLVSR
jgi:hypothetical protein